MERVKIKGVIIVILIIVILASAVAFWGSLKEEEVEIVLESIEVEVIDINEEVEKVIAERISYLQDEVLETLSDCETGGVQEQDAAIIFDRNGKVSIGRYQWQRESVQYYYKELYGLDISRVEAIQIAVDAEQASDLTKDVLFNEEDGWTNWAVCSKRNNIAGQVDLINKILGN